MGKFTSIIVGFGLLFTINSARADDNTCGNTMLTSLSTVQAIVGRVGDSNLTRFVNTGSDAAWQRTQTASLLVLSNHSGTVTAVLGRCARTCGDSSERLADLCQGLVGLSMSSMHSFISQHRGISGYKAKVQQAM